MDTVLYDKNGNALRVTKSGAVANFQRLPNYAQLVYEGKVWQVQDQITTAVLVASPTTTAGLTIQNPANSGKYYVVFALKAYVDVVPGTLGMVSSFHCAHKLAVTAYTRDITLASTGAGSISGLKAGQGAYSGSIILDRGATVVDDGWAATPLQIVSNIATTNFVAMETALVVPVIIPPSFHYSIAGEATVVTFEAGWGLTWAEVDESYLIYV